MQIKILGTGCKNCRKLSKNLSQAIAETGLELQVEEVGDLREIVAYGVMTTPCLVIDDQVYQPGKVWSVKDLKNLLQS